MVHPFLMATIDYMERLKNGEAPAFPPSLHMGSKISDYAEWLNRADLVPSDPVADIEAKIIGHTPQATTAIVWLKNGAPPETHTNEQEKFLIVEGTCDIMIGNDIHSMRPGDVLFIPLHISHSVKVTSDYPCKIILERAAA
jgi:mannose-6-phosphate isomerase-like protein (cupin superfamily)